MIYHQAKFNCKWISSSEYLVEPFIFLLQLYALIVTLAMKKKKIEKKNHLILKFMMMYHHTKFVANC